MLLYCEPHHSGVFAAFGGHYPGYFVIGALIGIFMCAKGGGMISGRYRRTGWVIGLTGVLVYGGSFSQLLFCDPIAPRVLYRVVFDIDHADRCAAWERTHQECKYQGFSHASHSTIAEAA